MKRLYLAVLFFLSLYVARSQPYGNEWINYSQNYYRIPIAAEGIYRLDSAALAASGIPLNGLDPRRFQIFCRGREQAIFVSGEADGILNTGDFIEFYAQKNNGHLDSAVYDTAAVPNPYHSLYSDTSVYFLTWNSSLANLRLAPVTDNTFTLYTPDPYFFRELLFMTSAYYHAGPVTFYGSYNGFFHCTEGWMSAPFYKGQTLPVTFNTSLRYAGGPDGTLTTVIAGESDDFTNFSLPDHELRLEYNTNSGTTLLADSLFNGYKLITLTFTIPLSTLTNSTTFSHISVNNPSFTWNNTTALSYSRLRFPQIMDLENQPKYTLHIPDNGSQSKAYLRISNFNDQGGNVFLYDLTNRLRIQVVADSGFHKVLVPNAGNMKECYLHAENSVISLSGVTPVGTNAQFTYYGATGYDSAFIIITHSRLWNESAQYAAYRSGVPGGSNHVLLAEIGQLYDQFAWGIKYHPAAIRRFADLCWDSASVKPEHLFLIGKSIVFPDARDYYPYLQDVLVPTFGYPPSDVLLTANQNGANIEPRIPTGRLSALTGAEVLDYLAKVQSHEVNPSAEWMKHALHFGGGTTQLDQQTFAGFLTGYENTFEDTLFGGFVHTFLKTTSQPIQITLSDSVRNLINNGVSLMTFFGHASGNSFDQNLDDPANYNNSGRYPFILANSCFSGDFHAPPNSFVSNASELWVVNPKGAIGFLASVGQGITYYIDQFAQQMYRQFGQINYGSSIGECMQAAIDSAQGTVSDLFMNITLMEYNLQGDPSVRLNPQDKPDYAIADSSVYFTPGPVITAEVDSFEMNIVITNLGRAPRDTVIVELKRIFPDNSESIYTLPVPFVLFRDTLQVRMPVDLIKGPGINRFEVWVDSPQQIDEGNEGNNQLLTPAQLFIVSGDIVPVYPYEFAIIPNDTVTLKASTGDPFEAPHNYRFEIDTNDLYSNPLSALVVSAPGGVISWTPPLTLTDTTVYFWRVRRDTSDTVNYRWKEFSFQYVPGKRGWEQSHFFQFKNNDHVFVKHNRPTRTWDFVPVGKTLTVDCYGQQPPFYNYSEMSATQYKLDLSVQEYAGCGFVNAMLVAIIDPVTLQPWGNRWFDASNNVMLNPTHFFGNANDIPSGGPCGRNRVEKYFIFQWDQAAQLAGMKNLLENVVPNGYYILAYSWLSSAANLWVDTSLYTTFETLGSDTIRDIGDVPYIFFCKKGDPGSAQEVVGAQMDSYINFTAVLSSNSDAGNFTGPLIGPAMSWDSISWYQHGLENPTADSVSLNVYGVNNAGAETLLQTYPPSQYAIDLSSLNAATYPYLRLNLFIKDDSLGTSAQMDKWQVFYQPAPEVAVHPPLGWSLYADTLAEGDSVKFRVAVKNISEFFMDSMQVNHWVIDRNRVSHPQTIYFSASLYPDSSLQTTITLPTEGLAGLNQLWMEINPVGTAFTQREQYHFNNIATIDFFVGDDKINPLLDVTFDGVHILNGDIISARPDILIQLKDENQFLALNDTADFKLWLKYPGASTYTRFYFNDPRLIFTPAALPDNSCRINFLPVLLLDGVYELLVQAQDRSNNLSGSMDMRISFEVENKPSITEVMNYPNPFSTSTRFVFTLTGSDLPETFTIQILTITGKVVREISKEELGHIHIGRNITEYAWDGRDQYGDLLGNGIYLYRVMTRLHGNAIEHRESGADPFIHKGFGKMYLMR
ncbi:MAG: hypothetical protein IT233_02215 [Bacteroidia bacterium]|nr:hypothetical protein [Bacteroidia bacterium]